MARQSHAFSAETYAIYKITTYIIAFCVVLVVVACGIV